MTRGTPSATPSAVCPASVRLDVLLHSLCLTPTRSQAARAIDEGHVRVNGATVRPAHLVRAGDTLALMHGHRTRTYQLTTLPARGQARKDAPQFYTLLSDEDTAR